MRGSIAPLFALMTATALGGCSEKAANQIEATGGTIGNDIRNGLDNADDKVAAGLNHAGAAIDNASDRIGAATADAKRDAAEAKRSAGEALEKAGKKLKN
jgi:hypothetical protein